MNTSNYPTANYDGQTPSKNSKNTIIVVLAIAFAGTWGYLLVNENKTVHVIKQNQTQIAKISDEKVDIRKSFDESLARLDSMAGIATGLKNKLIEENSEI